MLQYWSIITLVGDTVSIELEEDGSLALSSLKALVRTQQDCVSPQKMVEDEVSEF